MKKMHSKHALKIVNPPKRPLDSQQPPFSPITTPVPTSVGLQHHLLLERWALQDAGVWGGRLPRNPQNVCVILEDTELLAFGGAHKEDKTGLDRVLSVRTGLGGSVVHLWSSYLSGRCCQVTHPLRRKLGSRWGNSRLQGRWTGAPSWAHTTESSFPGPEDTTSGAKERPRALSQEI